MQGRGRRESSLHAPQTNDDDGDGVDMPTVMAINMQIVNEPDGLEGAHGRNGTHSVPGIEHSHSGRR